MLEPSEASNSEEYIARKYTSIWNEIERQNIIQLSTHPDLILNLNQKQFDRTPLFLACQRKSFDMVHFLLHTGENT